MADEKKKHDSKDGNVRVRLGDLLNPENIRIPIPQFHGGQGSGVRSAEEARIREERLKGIREFELTPREIRDYLDRFVISQDDAKKVLSVAICDHYNHVRRCLERPEDDDEEFSKHNVLMLGPTGVGKTYLMRCLARLIGVPFVKADATKFSATGYVGYDVADIVRDLVKAGGDDPELAQFGIVYIDEIDKIAGGGAESGPDVSRRGVQINLLKLMEDAEVRLISQTDVLKQMQAVFTLQSTGKPPQETIRTRHMLFIVSGAFDRLPELVRHRLGRTRIGFGESEAADRDDATPWLQLAETSDLVEFGFEPEFVGRLPVRVALNDLDADDLATILATAEDSILNQYRDDFSGYGIELEVSRDAIREIAVRAHREKTGARGLMTVLERLFREFKFELPSTSARHLNVTVSTICQPEDALAKLLRKQKAVTRDVLLREVRAFSEEFAEAHGLSIHFTPKAAEAMVDLAEEEKRRVLTLCEERFRDLEYGLRLISRNTGKTEFTMTKEMVQYPDRVLSRWVTRSFETDES